MRRGRWECKCWLNTLGGEERGEGRDSGGGGRERSLLFVLWAGRTGGKEEEEAGRIISLFFFATLKNRGVMAIGE